MYYDKNNTQKIFFFSAGQWQPIIDVRQLEPYQLKTEKNEPNGYVGLDSLGEILIEYLKTGNAQNRVLILGEQIGTGEVIMWDGHKFATRSLDDKPEIYTATIVGDGLTKEWEFPQQGSSDTYPDPSSVSILDQSGQIVYMKTVIAQGKVTLTANNAPQQGIRYTVKIIA